MPDQQILCDCYVDINGLDCAVPFAKLNEALAALAAGQTLMATSWKQALQRDIPAFCRQKNVSLVEQGKTDGQYYFMIRK